jgi:hypothetical protein
MAKCNLKFTVTVKGQIDAVLAKVNTAAKAHDVKFEGNIKKGSFSGEASGSYTVSGQDITITVTEKPWPATEKTIQDAVRKFFQGL